MKSLAAILQDVMAQFSLEKAFSQARIQKHWEAAVGPAIAAHARPEEVRSRKLYVSVDSALWLQELTLMKPSLIERLNALLEEGEGVGDLVLRLGQPRASGPGPPDPT
jgi:predicted nucleic acid-binding Zn ribbon protein